jgi:predicted site-specific integrase-resolvase
LQELIRLVLDGKVHRVFVTYKDRLTRFGYRYLEATFSYHGVPIMVVKDKDREKSVEEELVEDMMSLTASFSGKLYGLRSGKNRRKGETQR